MENTIFKIGLIIGAALALPKMILGLLEFLKWFFSVVLVFFFPTRGGNTLKIISENFNKQTVFTSKLSKQDKELIHSNPSG